MAAIVPLYPWLSCVSWLQRISDLFRELIASWWLTAHNPTAQKKQNMFLQEWKHISMKYNLLLIFKLLNCL